MATDPNTLLPAPQDTAALGRDALRAYFLENKGKATLEGAKAVGAQFGLTVSDSAQAAVDWANRKDTDINLLPIFTKSDVLAEPGEAARVDITPPAAPEGTMFEGVPLLEGVYTPEVLGQGLLDATIATGKGAAKAATGAYDLLNLAAGGVQQGVNYFLTNAIALGEEALGNDPSAIQQFGQASRERISQATDLMSPRAGLDRLIPTPEGYENLEFGAELLASLVTPIVPFAPKVRPPIRAPRPGLRTPAAAAAADGSAPPPSPVPEGTRLTEGEIDTALAGMEARGRTEPVGTIEQTRRVADFAKDYVQEAGVTWGGKESGVPFSEFFRRQFNAGALSPERVEALYQKYGITTLDDFEELVTGSVGTVSKAGRTLREWRVTSAPIPRAAADEAGRLTRELPGPDRSLWERMGGVTRSGLIAEIAKTTRDLASGAVQLPIDMFANTVDNLIVSALNPVRRAQGFDTRNVNFGDAFVLVGQALRPSRRMQGKNVFEQLRNNAPDLNKRVLDLYNSDVPRPGAVNDAFSKVEKAVDVFNFANRFTDSFMRRVAFPAFLRREANRAGFNYDELVAQNNIAQLPAEILEKAIDDTLGFVFSKKPGAGGELFLGKNSEMLVRAIEKVGGPVGTATVGFPRFIANAWNYTYRFSPAGLGRIFTEKGLKNFDKGDVRAISEGLTGTAMLYAALQFQNSDLAGSKWYMARNPETGKEADLRPIFPLGPYLFFADLIKRAPVEFGGDGTFDKAYTAKDIMQGLTGTQFRAGASEYVLEGAMDDIREIAAGGEDAGQKVMNTIGKALGSFLGGLVPMGGTVSDLVAQIDPEQRVQRDTAFAPFLGPALREIPYAQSELLGLPESQSVTRASPMTREDPIVRQVMGLAIKPAPTELERELNSLGIQPFRLYTKTKVPEIDSRMMDLMGQIADNYAGNLLSSPKYMTANKIARTDLVEDFYKNVRAAAREVLDTETPAYSAIREYQGLDREGKIVLDAQIKEQTGKTAMPLFRQLLTAPIVNSQEEVDALPAGAKYTDPGDYKVYTKK
jgi:hypothetical protein